MSAVMPVLALVLLICGWAGIIPMGDLALTEHGLMMPAMLVPMLRSLAFYTGCAHTLQASPLSAKSRPQSGCPELMENEPRNLC